MLDSFGIVNTYIMPFVYKESSVFLLSSLYAFYFFFFAWLGLPAQGWIEGVKVATLMFFLTLGVKNVHSVTIKSDVSCILYQI